MLRPITSTWTPLSAPEPGGVFACVVAVAGSAAIATQAGHDRSDTMASPSFGSAAVTARDLGGRWTAVRIDGRDVTSWRDAGGNPANLVIGADDTPNGWQVNRACGPLVGGSFALHADGSFTATMPPPGFQSCPMISAQPPDLVDAVTRTAYVFVEKPAGSATRTLRFLDGHRRLVALWREDASIASGAALCKKVLGRVATSDGTFTTVERIRAKHLAGARTKSEDVLPGVPGGTVAVYCSAPEAGSPVRYAVTADAHKVRLRPAG
ncbi:hypothetical protein ACFW1F_30630 [Streptomyces bungoensis]|uniref:hypothetical protein n=1 Tax=Streptomyces bungoensis TaxID=285568 RepID=UPI0036BE857A